MQYFIASAINSAHSAFADFRYDVVVAEYLTDHGRLPGVMLVVTWKSRQRGRCVEFETNLLLLLRFWRRLCGSRSHLLVSKTEAARVHSRICHRLSRYTLLLSPNAHGVLKWRLSRSV